MAGGAAPKMFVSAKACRRGVGVDLAARRVSRQYLLQKMAAAMAAALIGWLAMWRRISRWRVWPSQWRKRILIRHVNRGGWRRNAALKAAIIYGNILRRRSG